jgi:hypothetical protein
MEVSRDVAVEIVGGEEEEGVETEVTQVVLIPSAQDNKTLFTTIFDDTTIEPLEIKLRSIMDAQLNTTHLVAERGKVATSNFTLGIFRQRDINDRPHTRGGGRKNARPPKTITVCMNHKLHFFPHPESMLDHHFYIKAA